MANESKYAAQLSELGFIPAQEILSPKEMKEANDTFEQMSGRSAKMPRAQRRKLLAKKLLPAFMYFEDETHVLDEFGSVWIATQHIDLTHLGFHDGIDDYLMVTIPIMRKH